VWDGAAMVRARLRALAGHGDASLIDKLCAMADAQMKLPSVVRGISVTDKPVVPPSGDKRDYYSVAAYIWPCDTKCNASLEPYDCSRWCTPLVEGCNWTKYWGLYGWEFNGGHRGKGPMWRASATDHQDPPGCNATTGMPWVTHDGYSTYANPATPWIGRLDRPRADKMWDAVVPMLVAHWYTNRTEYANVAARLLRTFFLDEARGMKPNLNFAVNEPGAQACNDGLAGTARAKACGWGGTVDFANMRYALNAISLLEFADRDGLIWTKRDRDGLRAWMKGFLSWWLGSPLGQSSRALTDNIGTAYTITVLSMANYSYQPYTATAVVNADALRHIAQQIAPDGSIPCEDAPMLEFSFGYHVGDLLILHEMGYAASTTRADVDPFDYQGYGAWPKYGTNRSGSLSTALAWLAPFCARERRWTISKESPLDDEGPLCVLLYRMAALTFPANHTRFMQVAAKAKDAIENSICFGLTCSEWADLTWPSVAPPSPSRGKAILGSSTADDTMLLKTDDDLKMRSLLRRKFPAYGRKHDPRRPPLNLVGERLAGACPSDLATIVDSSGSVPVPYFLRPNGSDTLDNAPAVRAAINATKFCGGSVFFPGGMEGHTAFQFRTTVVIGHGDGPIALRGAGTSSGGLTQTPPASTISGPHRGDTCCKTCLCNSGPAFMVTETQDVHFSDMEINGWHTAVIIIDAANVRFTNVAINAGAQAPGIENVGLTPSTCVGCNVVFGSNNSALVVVNSFWIWITDSMFTFVPSCHNNGSSWNGHQGGQRPAIILRGDTAGKHFGVNTVYLFSVERSSFEGGGIQYQQVANGSQWAGYYTLSWITLEESATPLLDVQVKPGVTDFMGLQSITITEYSGADDNPPYYLGQYPHLLKSCSDPAVDNTGYPQRFACNQLVPIVGLNCSDAPNCALDGLTIIGASGFEGSANPQLDCQSNGSVCHSGSHAPAVRVYEGGDGIDVVNPGRVKAVTVLSPQLTGGNDVLDAANRPVGAWVSRSAGGLTVVAGDGGADGPPNDALLTAGAASPSGPGGEMVGTLSSSHALLVGVSGERNARLGLESTGAVRWGTGKSAKFDTTLQRLRTNTSVVGGMEMPAGMLHRLTVAVEGAAKGDVCMATHTALGEEEAVFVHCRVVKPGAVLVFLKNEELGSVSIGAGELRVVVASVRE
jgi:hypothetical protein